jgi:hypothetical protein
VDLLRILYERIQPVLGPDRSDAEKAAISPPRNDRFHIADQLDDATRRTRDINAMVQHLLDRLLV